MLCRRLVCVCAGLLLVLSLALPSRAVAAPMGSAEWTYVVKAPLGLFLRAEPALTSEITLALFNGEDVRSEGEAAWSQGIWWRRVRVERYAGTWTGWVVSAHLANDIVREPTEPDPDALSYTVTAVYGLKLRSAPGLGSAVRYVVPRDTRLVATEEPMVSASGLQWRQFALDGQTVWGAATWVRRVEPSVD